MHLLNKNQLHVLHASLPCNVTRIHHFVFLSLNADMETLAADLENSKYPNFLPKITKCQNNLSVLTCTHLGHPGNPVLSRYSGPHRFSRENLVFPEILSYLGKPRFSQDLFILEICEYPTKLLE